MLAGGALLVIEGEERLLRRWDFVHCPTGTNHVLIGAGDGPCLVLAVGARDHSTGPDWGAYTVDAAAIRHGAGALSMNFGAGSGTFRSFDSCQAHGAIRRMEDRSRRPLITGAGGGSFAAKEVHPVPHTQ